MAGARDDLALGAMSAMQTRERSQQPGDDSKFMISIYYDDTSPGTIYMRLGEWSLD